ncbi:MAG: hypothetical protein HRT61_01780 [Ekhidna sp.]|nr:hypothetical protein [Ekhidna sp.]
MKKYIATLSLMLLGFISFSQEFKAPKTGAKIFAQEYMFSLDQNGETSFDLWIVRSKMARRTKFTAPKLVSSSDLQFTVEQDSENQDHYVVTVSANNVPAKQYSATVSSKSNGSQKVTGTTLSFQVLGSPAVASKDGE